MERREIITDVAIQVMVQVAGVLIIVGVVKLLTKPDMMRTMKMSAALRIKQIADIQVEAWQSVAGKAATAYQKARV